jgi:hypothetical protein
MSIEDGFKKIMMRAFNPPLNNAFDPEQEIMDQLILKNAISLVGFNSDNEPLYTFTPKIKDIMPELYEEHLNIVNAELMNLWEKGFLNINFLEEDPTVTLTDLAFDLEQINTLSYEEKWSLEEAKRLMKR